MTSENQQPGDLERRARELMRKVQEAEGAQGSKKFVESKDLEETLKEVDSHVVLPRAEYHIDFDIVISPHGTLEIEPGTKIYFGPEAGIISYGTLKAVGTEEDRILFNVLLTAMSDTWNTVMDCTWKNIAIAGKWADESVLEYCTISRGSGRKEIPKTEYSEGLTLKKNMGGGVLVLRSDPTIRYCTIESNQAYSGGGLSLYESSPVLEGNMITYNNAQLDGGGLDLWNSSPVLEGNMIIGNKAGWGGGLFLYESNPTLKGNTITCNQVRWFGGGLHLWYSSPVLEGNMIIGNQAEKGGGGLNLGYNSSPVLNDNKIKNNKPDNKYISTLYPPQK